MEHMEVSENQGPLQHRHQGGRDCLDYAQEEDDACGVWAPGAWSRQPEEDP